MQSETVKAEYRKSLIEHNDQLAALLATYPEDVGKFMRSAFQLAMYPLPWVQQFADKLNAFRP